MRAATAALLLLGGTAVACGTAEDAVPVDVPDGWVPLLLRDPGQLEARMTADESPRWIAAHAGRWVAPTTGPQPGFVNAQADVEDSLGRAEAALFPGLIQRWAERGQLPEGSALVPLAALSCLDAQVPLPEALVERLGPLSAWAKGPTDNWLAQPVPVPAVQQCVTSHARARQAGALPDPDACTALTDGGRLPDPLARHTRALALRAAQTSSDVLTATAFTARWSTAKDLPADASAEALAAVDARLKSWEAALLADAPPGARLADELALFAGHRSRQRAAHIAAGLVHRDPPLPPLDALALLRGGIDAAAGERVGPTNPPLLLALLAEARLRTGRTREALDALHGMRDAWIDMDPLIELAGDYHVAAGLGRDGDSKEL